MRNTPGAEDKAQCHQLTQGREGNREKKKGWTLHEGMSADGTLKLTNQRNILNIHFIQASLFSTYSRPSVYWLEAPQPLAHTHYSLVHPSSYLTNNSHEEQPYAMHIWFGDKELSGVISLLWSSNRLWEKCEVDCMSLHALFTPGAVQARTTAITLKEHK